MRKILSILSAVGLSATAGASVVSCGNNIKHDLNYKDFRNLTIDSWNYPLANLTISKKETNVKDMIAENNERIIAISSSKFKNYTNTYQNINNSLITGNGKVYILKHENSKYVSLMDNDTFANDDLDLTKDYYIYFQDTKTNFSSEYLPIKIIVSDKNGDDLKIKNDFTSFGLVLDENGKEINNLPEDIDKTLDSSSFKRIFESLITFYKNYDSKNPQDRETAVKNNLDSLSKSLFTIINDDLTKKGYTTLYSENQKMQTIYNLLFQEFYNSKNETIVNEFKDSVYKIIEEFAENDYNFTNYYYIFEMDYNGNKTKFYI